MNTEKDLQESAEQALTIPVVMQRFQDFIDDYEKNIAREKAFLSGLDPIETCDDILYELQIRRDALKKCYEQVFNVA
jgi:flagellar biosynthesis chaperone FliJ